MDKKITRLGVAYCRVSTDRETQENSIKEQQKQWLEFFNKTSTATAKVGLICHREVLRIRDDGKAIKGKLITEIRNDGLYIDEGISGKSLQNRKAFQCMIEDAKKKKFDMIYVEDVSRFSRSSEDGYKAIKDLRDIGVGVFFRKEGWDSLDLSKDFELQLRLGIAQEENRAKSERFKWALNRLWLKGGWSGGIPYGYDVDKAYLKINKEEAEQVKLIFDLFANKKWGMTRIAKHLNYDSVPTKRGGVWSHTQIADILHNKIYIGKQVLHKTESYDITRHTTRNIEPEDWIIHQKEELRIIDDDLFNITQIELERRIDEFSFYNIPRVHDKDSNYRLFSGLFYCAHCGRAFRRKVKNTYRRKDGTKRNTGYMWVCSLYDNYGGKEKGGCPGKRVQLNEDVILEAIKYEIKGLKKSNTDDFFKLYMKDKFKVINIHQKEELEKKQEKLNGEMRQLRQDKVDNLIDDEVYKEHMSKLNKEISDVKTTISRIEHMDEERKHNIDLYTAYKKTIDDVDIDNLTNEVLRSIFYKIYVSCTQNDKGKTIPTLRFVYRFIDTTNDDIIKSYSENDKNLHIFQSIFAYKTAEIIDNI